MDFKYNLLEDGTAEITAYTGSSAEIDIPASIEGNAVSRIGPDCFSGSGLIKVVIPDGVTSIGSFAFYECLSLDDVRIPGSVRTIESFAFDSCSSLLHISIPDGVCSIGDSAFRNSTSLGDISIPDSVTFIGECAFRKCGALTKARLPEQLTILSVKLFSECACLTNIRIPDSVTSIGYQAFAGCSRLKSLAVPANVVSIGRDAFPKGNRFRLKVVCGSYAADYCMDHHIKLEYLTGSEQPVNETPSAPVMKERELEPLPVCEPVKAIPAEAKKEAPVPAPQAAAPEKKANTPAGTGRPVPYQGQNTYIFISYSHLDRDRVYPIVSSMNNMGLRVWFDEGIDPGTEWDENIAMHVQNCDAMISFISPNYLESDNCKDELNYARDLKKDRLLVYLENVDLPAGMAMRMNRIQAIHRYAYSNQEDFLANLMRCKFIARNR